MRSEGSRPSGADLALVILLCAAKGALWVALMPPLQTPDELAHFTYVHFLAERGRLPSMEGPYEAAPEVEDFARRVHYRDVAFHPEVRYRPESASGRPLPRGPENGASSVAGYPPAYYAIASLGYRAVWSRSIEARFYSARVISAILGLATVAAAWALGRLLVPASRSFAIALALLVGLQPMASMMAGAVNNDALMIPVSAVTVLLALRCAPGAGAREHLMLGLAMGVGLLSKPQGVFLAIAVGLVLLRRAVIGDPATSRRALRNLVVTGSAAALVSGWWAFLAWRRFGSAIGAIAAPPQPGTLGSPWRAFLEGNFLSKAALSRAFHLWVKTYWADFGWLDTHFGSLVPYLVIAALVLLAAIGLVRNLRRRQPRGRDELGFLLFLVAANIVFLYAVEAAYVSRYHAFMLQGRYLFTVLLPISALLLVGWRSLVPERRRTVVDMAAVSGIVVLHAASLLLVVGRYYGVGFV